MSPGALDVAKPSAVPTPARAEARLAAFRLIETAQTSEIGHGIAAQLVEAESQGWPEVTRILLYADVVHAFVTSAATLGERIERLRQCAERDGDDVMLAIALASRSEHHYCSESGSLRQQSDHDLARATALLDVPAGAALERATAYVACAVSYSVRELWELEEEMYAQAVALLSHCEVPLLDGVVLFNRAEAYVRIACGLREVDETDVLTQVVAAGAAPIQAAVAGPVPVAWRVEARVYRHLLAAIAGGPAVETSADLDAAVTQIMVVRTDQVCGMLRLADALRAAAAGDWAAVARFSEQARKLFPATEPIPALALSLRLAAQADAALGSVGAGRALRYGEYSARRRWESRMRTLGSARASLQTEQLRVDRDIHAREALIDELTGLTNRRGYARHLRELSTRADHHRVAVLLVDIDQFKSVNDTHGHAVGDTVLIQVARALTGATRPEDLVARVGGDEFVVVFDDLDATAGQRRGLDIQDRLSRVRWEELSAGLEIGVSVGVAAGCAPPDPEVLVRQADLALYAAKAQGGSNVQLAPTQPVTRTG